MLLSIVFIAFLSTIENCYGRYACPADLAECSSFSSTANGKRFLRFCVPGHASQYRASAFQSLQIKASVP